MKGKQIQTVCVQVKIQVGLWVLTPLPVCTVQSPVGYQVDLPVQDLSA